MGKRRLIAQVERLRIDSEIRAFAKSLVHPGRAGFRVDSLDI
jgi:hypothetical protein